MNVRPIEALVLVAAAFALVWTRGWAQEPLPEARGVWMSRDVILAGPARMEQVFYRLARANFNRVLVDVQYQGATIYPSAVMAAAGGPEQRAEFSGRDPLQEAIEIGHRFGLEVVAWFEYGLMAHTHPSDSTDRGPLLAAHPSWVAIRRNGSSVVANENGYFHWLDPAHPEVVSFMEELFAEVAARCPGLDGIETDRIRYPSTEFSYSEMARVRYVAETGGSDPLLLDPRHPEWAQWVRWREQQTTALARRIYRRVKAIRPDVLVSAAVAPPYMLLAGEKLQAWHVWADSGYVDALEPMLYLPDEQLENQLTSSQNLVPATFALYPGIAYRNDSSLLFQVDRVRQSGCAGVTIWYDGAMTEQTLQRLGLGIFAQRVRSPHNEVIINDGDGVRFHSSGPWQTVQGGFLGGALQVGAGSAEASATWSARVLREGLYEVFARWPLVVDAANEVRCHLHSADKEIVCVVDQRKHPDTWVFLCADTLRHGESVTLTVYGATSGTVTADAVRLLRVGELSVDDCHVPDSVHIELKFSRAVDTSSATRSESYALDQSAQVLSAALLFGEPSVVRLTVTPLVPEQPYALRLVGVRDRAGNFCRTAELLVTFAPARTTLVVDDGSATFRPFGAWSTMQEGRGFVGEGYALSAAGRGENRAQWWTEVRQDGLYQLSVGIPDCAPALARRVPYFVLHHFGLDTVYVDQEAARGGWAPLGRRYFRAGDFASVMVVNLADSGMVVADACRLQRVLDTAVAKEAGRPEGGIPLILSSYPNPFNGETTVTFVLPGHGSAQVKVFNVQGQEVDTVTTPVLAPGLHKVNLALRQVPSGLYLCQLFYVDERGATIPGASTRKLVLIR